MTERPKIGNEIDSKRGRVLDLRNINHAKQVSAEIARRALTPQINVEIPAGEITREPAAWVFNGVAYDLLIIVILGFVSIGTPYRDWAFLVYFVLVLVFRISSQRVFRLALISLVLIPISLGFLREALGQDFAIFAFYFMAIGVIRAMIELKKTDK